MNMEGYPNLLICDSVSVPTLYPSNLRPVTSLPEPVQDDLSEVHRVLSMDKIGHLLSEVEIILTPEIEGGMRGCYHPHTKRIFLTLSNDPRPLSRTLLHEIGHHVWRQHLAESDRLAWKQWYIKNSVPLSIPKWVARLPMLGIDAENLFATISHCDYSLGQRLYILLTIMGHEDLSRLTAKQALEIALSCETKLFKYTFSNYALPHSLDASKDTKMLANETFAEAFLWHIGNRSLPAPVARQLRLAIANLAPLGTR